MDISKRELSDERTSSPELALNCVILPRGVFFLIGKGGAMSPLPPASTPESPGAVNCAMVSRDLLADLSKLVDGDRLPDPPDTETNHQCGVMLWECSVDESCTGR